MISEISYILSGFIKAKNGGRAFAAGTGFTLSQPGEPETVLAPDIAFVRAERIPAKGSPML